jgi:hypothetical protein
MERNKRIKWINKPQTVRGQHSYDDYSFVKFNNSNHIFGSGCQTLKSWISTITNVAHQEGSIEVELMSYEQAEKLGDPKEFANISCDCIENKDGKCDFVYHYIVNRPYFDEKRNCTLNNNCRIKF